MDTASLSTAIAERNPDDIVIETWLGTHKPHSQRAYRHDIDALRKAIEKPLQHVTLADLQVYAGTLTGAPATRARAVNAIKSLFAFARATGYTPFDVAMPLQVPDVPDTLAERILLEKQVTRLIDGEKNARNHAILSLLYYAGLRVSELTGLEWRNVTERQEGGGYVSAFGKRGKTRAIVISQELYVELLSLQGDAGAHDPVFLSREGGSLTAGQVENIVKQAALRVHLATFKDAKGVMRSHVSPHWLRHCFASHLLDRGAPIALVQQTLGHASLVATSRYTHVHPDASILQYLPQ